MSYLELKSKADKLFKDYAFDDAVDFYQKALLVDESNHIILNSNLSACHFELGISRTI